MFYEHQLTDLCRSEGAFCLLFFLTANIIHREIEHSNKMLLNQDYELINADNYVIADIQKRTSWWWGQDSIFLAGRLVTCACFSLYAEKL